MVIISDQPRIELTEVIGEFATASNLTLLATDAAGAKWVYKAERAMSELWDFDATTLPRREVAAFVLSEALGFHLVPQTGLAIGPLGPGSAQRFLDADDTVPLRPLFVPSVSQDLWPLAVFDLLANNADRKLGHLLAEKGRLWAIDNGLTFHSEPKIRTVLWGFAGQPIPDKELAAVGALERSLAGALGASLTKLLDRSEIVALQRRVRALLDARVHPLPPSDRPAMPWPVW
jgi:uncharacterized repeat protein (TIGR03843 family)